MVRLPGLVDVHVHLRQPGEEHKETVDSGTAAALAGGFVAVLAMPNTRPPVTDGPTLDQARALYASRARCDVGLFVGATADNAVVAAEVADRACGLKVYCNTSYGRLRLKGLAGLVAHFGTWPRGRPIVVHAEGTAVAQAIGLAAAFGRHVHLAHLSRAEEIRLVAAAKEAGLPVTCEVAPHHLFLTEADLAHLKGFGQVRPPLATAADREALWANLAVVDCIATDHAPHTRREKESSDPPPGMPGLETALPLMLTAVHQGRLTLDRLVELMSTTPARIFGLTTPAESAVEVDLDEVWTLPEHGYQTKVDWSPFAGLTVHGRVRRTLLRGQVGFADGVVRARPGTGRLVPEGED